ncbi:MAG: ATP-binding protein [Pseudomonadota bacterium]
MRRLLGRLVLELHRIRYRLLLVNVLVVAVPITGIAFARFYEREMLASLEQGMVNQARILRQALLSDPQGLRLGERGPMLARAAVETRTRIRLLDGKGQLLADSHASGPPEGPERPAPRLLAEDRTVQVEAEASGIGDLAGRREMRQALKGSYGSATRLWQSVGRVYLFSALPIIPDGREGSAGHVAGVIYVTRSTAPVKLAMFRLRSSLFKILAVSLGITTILSLYLATTISRPLSRLTRTAARARAGEQEWSLALDRKDEIGELARAFDSMARKLQERARYIGELAANVSHEFKSPLTSIRGAAELLLDGAADNPEARARFLRNVVDDCQRLDRLVTRLLELSRVEADTTPAEVFDYEALVRQAAKECKTELAIVIHYRASATQVHGRRAHLLSTLSNLLDNASHHASPGTEIVLEVGDTCRGRQLRTSVHNDNQDTPISPANLRRVWDRFFTTRADHGGTGLGLAIVASVVRAHGGSTGVTSTAEDGTTFWFDIPWDENVRAC